MTPFADSHLRVRPVPQDGEARVIWLASLEKAVEMDAEATRANMAEQVDADDPTITEDGYQYVSWLVRKVGRSAGKGWGLGDDPILTGALEAVELAFGPGVTATVAVPNTAADDLAVQQALVEGLAEASPDEVDRTLAQYEDWQRRGEGARE